MCHDCACSGIHRPGGLRSDGDIYGSRSQERTAQRLYMISWCTCMMELQSTVRDVT